jgi:periplasmic protein TonB
MSPTELLNLRETPPATEPRKWGSAFVASLSLHVGLALLIVLGISIRSAPVATQSPIQTKLIYVAEPGPSGGGGGNPAPAAARRMEVPRHRAPDPVPAEVAPPPDKAPPEPVLDAPVTTMAATALSAMGTSVTLPGPGGGREAGTGVGPGAGPGVGPGGPGGIGGGPRQIGNGVSSPTLVRSRDPEYTSDAMRKKTQGNVELEVVVRANGTVGDVRVTKSLDPELDQQAIKAAKQWLFRPGTLAGSPVDVYVTLIIEFRLH